EKWAELHTRISQEDRSPKPSCQLVIISYFHFERLMLPILLVFLISQPISLILEMQIHILCVVVVIVIKVKRH
ncbi:hypothetical protein ACJX0J_040840, partial [Zea mays]